MLSCGQVGILNFERYRLATTPAPPWGGAARLARIAVLFTLTHFCYRRLAYYCHIKIRALYFVSNFQFSLYRMLARARRLAGRHCSSDTCLALGSYFEFADFYFARSD